MSMKAIVLHGVGGTEVLIEDQIPTPTLKPEEILVKVHATALNRCDILQRKGQYEVPPSNSPILGIEISGVVSKIGDRVTNFKPGDRVFGYVNGGGYAEYCVQDEGFVLPLPEHLSFIEGAAIAEVFQTANEAIFTFGHLKKDQILLIHSGASGVGSAAIQMAKAINAKVIVTVGSQEKVEFCYKLGADLAINYKQNDFVKETLAFTNQEGVDVLVDSIGPEYFTKNITCLKHDARFILLSYGYKSEVSHDFDFRPFLVKRLMMKGINTRGRPLKDQRAITQRFREQWLSLFNEKKLKPIVDKVYPMKEVALAHQRMEDNLNMGKIILEIDSKI